MYRFITIIQKKSFFLYEFLSFISYIFDEVAKVVQRKIFCLRFVGEMKGGKIGFYLCLILLAMLPFYSGLAISSEKNLSNDRRYNIDVSSQNAAEALNLLAKQTGAILLFSYDEAEVRKTHSVYGRYSLMEALKILLQGSGLSSDLSEKGVLTISLGESEAPISNEESIMKKKKILAATISLLVGAGASQSLLAQGDEAELLETIEVTASYRKAMEKAIDIKRMEKGFSDSLVATDIANFPEQNLVEALQRMPGITMERKRGIGTGVTVRGLPSEYTHIAIDGVASATNDLSIFAADVVQTVTIRKSPKASDEEGGIAGTIELQTARPFDYDEDRFIFTADGSYNDTSEKTDTKFAGLASKQFNDQWAALFSYSVGTRTARTDQDGGTTLRQSSRWLEKSNTQLFQDALSDYGYVINDPTDRAETDMLAIFKNVSRRAYLDTQDKWGSTLSLQYKPSDTFSLTFGAMLSGYDTRADQYAATDYTSDSPSYPEEIHAIDSTSLAEYGISVITDATYAATQHELVTDREEYEKDYGQYSADIEWQVAGWDVNALAGYSSAHFKKLRQEVKYETHQRTRSFVTATGTETVQAAASENDPTPWDPFAADSVLDYAFQINYNEGNDTKDDKYVFAISGANDFDTDWFTLEVGARYTSKTRDTKNGSTRVYGTSADDDSWKNNRNIEQSEVVSVQSLIPGGAFTAGGEDWYAIPAGDIKNLFWYDGLTINYDLDSIWEVEETTTALYAMTDFDFDVADMPVNLNIGARYTTNDVSSVGYQKDSTSDTGYSDERLKVTGESSDFLPSMNLTVDLTEDLVFRAAASKTIIRPSTGQLRSKRSINYGNNTISDGNPSLESTDADQWELGLEYYLPEGGLVAFSFYDKTIRNSIENQLTGTETLSVTLGDGSVISEEFEVYQNVNVTGDYKVDGYEFNIQVPLGGYIDALEGFGIDANYTKLNTSVVGSEVTEYAFIPTVPQDYIDDTYNMTGYYENENFDVRVSYNYKSDYYDNISYNLYPIYRKAFSQIDLSTSYNVNDDVKVSLKVINLTDEAEITYNMSESFLSGYQKTGRRITLGVRAVF